MFFSDTHCHLETFPPELRTKTLASARAKHVDIIVSVGSSLQTSAEGIRIAQSHEGVLAAVGIHPWWAVPPTDEVRKGLKELTQRDCVVAIGEIGLDYVPNPLTEGVSQEVQREVFAYQISLARETGLPANVHCQGAHQDIMDIIHKEAGTGLKGISHGFSGDMAMLQDWLDLGFFISIGRAILQDESDSFQAAVRDIPPDRLLTETDSLCLNDKPLSEPAEVISVVEKLAAIRRTTVNEIADATAANLKRLFKL